MAIHENLEENIMMKDTTVLHPIFMPLIGVRTEADTERNPLTIEGGLLHPTTTEDLLTMIDKQQYVVVVLPS